jgi:hypothetical protein
VPGPSIADLAFAAAVLELPLTGVDPVRSSWQSPWLLAAEAMTSRDLLGAAAAYAELGARTNEAEARLLAAHAFAAAGRRPEADEQLRRALAFFREVGATAYVREAESLLAASA